MSSDHPFPNSRLLITNLPLRHFKLPFLLFAALLFGQSSSVFAKSDDSPRSSGTGFVVSREGHVLTNHHVVANCQAIRTSTNGAQRDLSVIATDTNNDLAIVKLPQPHSRVAQFRDGRTIRSGDGVVVVGFPLRGVLASEANVTTGTVSAMAGIGNDTRFLQITAPVQPGNSGGPALDMNGHVVGIVVGKLNALAMALATRDIPQNINFAIKDAVIKAFLESHSIRYEMALSKKQLEAADIGETAKQFTVVLECYSETVEAKQRALEVEQRALERERRALEKDRRSLAKERQREQQAKALRAQEENSRIARDKAQEGQVASAPSSSLSEDLAKDLDEEFKKINKLEVPKAVASVDIPSKPAPQPAPQVEAKVPSVKAVDTTLKVSGMAPGSNAYLALVRQRISNCWSAPPLDLTNQAYVVIVQFRLHRDGKVTGVSIEQSSGNEYYDLAGKRAVLSANPLPVFPADISDSYFDARFTFTVSSTEESVAFP
ncbi:TonB family protein [Nitrospira sp. CMX1]